MQIGSNVCIPYVVSVIRQRQTFERVWLHPPKRSSPHIVCVPNRQGCLAHQSRRLIDRGHQTVRSIIVYPASFENTIILRQAWQAIDTTVTPAPACCVSIFSKNELLVDSIIAVNTPSNTQFHPVWLRHKNATPPTLLILDDVAGRDIGHHLESSFVAQMVSAQTSWCLQSDSTIARRPIFGRVGVPNTDCGRSKSTNPSHAPAPDC